jgi:hypothetical protein
VKSDPKEGALIYRRVDRLLSAGAGGEVREGDCLLLEMGRMPADGELALVRSGRGETLRRWRDDGDGDVVGVVIGIKREI